MAIITYENYTTAVNDWIEAKSSFSDIKQVISPEQVFMLSREQIEWLDTEDDSDSYFRADIGIWKDTLILILTPRTDSGVVKILENYEFCSLQFLENDLTLKQTKTYTITSTYILSKDLSKSEQDSDYNLPVVNEPVTGQLKAVEEIESWKENAMDYLQRESLEFGGQRIFQSFYIPKADLLHNNENLNDVVCVFGFKYSAVYQRLLATLIFISNLDATSVGSANAVYAVQANPSNTYDWSKPVPPYIPG